MADKSRFIDGRIVGGNSLHARHDPTLCHDPFGRGPQCGTARCVDCCGVEDDRDILECERCGKQWSVRCTFDDDFA